MATKTVIKTGCMPTAPVATGQHRGISIIIDQQQQQAQPQQQQKLNQNQQQQYQQQHQSATKIIIQQKGDDVASLPGSKSGGLVKMATDRGECILNMPQNGRGELATTTSCNISCNGYNNSNNNTNIYTNNTASIDQLIDKPQCESEKERGAAEASQAKPENEKMLLDVAGKSSQTPNANGRNVLLVVGANNNTTTTTTTTSSSNNKTNGISITTTTTSTTKTLHNESNGTSSLGDNDIRGGSGSGSGSSTRMIIKCSTHDADDDGPKSLSNSATTTTCESNGKRAHEESSRDHQHHHHDDRQQHHRGVVTVTGRGDSDCGIGECENGQPTVDCQRLGVGEAATAAAAESQLERPPSPQRSGSLATKVDDCASAVTTNGPPERRSAATLQQQRASNVLTIQINRDASNSRENLERDNEPSDEPKGKLERQVTVVSVNSVEGDPPQRFFHTDLTPAANSSNSSSAAAMVHKAQTMASGGAGNVAAANNNNSSVTELNVSNNSYLYYMMTSSSGQFSPCDTLDSGTGSDLESNGHGGGSTPNSKLMSSPMEKVSPNITTTTANSNSKPNQSQKLELHLKTTKLRLGGSSNGSGGKLKSRYPSSYEEHDDVDCDGDESEECESTSSLSCDSLHSSEFNMSPRATKASSKSGIPQPPSPPAQQLASMKLLSSMLPDSLLRDIRDRKFPASDFVSKYHQHSGGEESHESASSESSSAGDKSPTHDYSLEVQEHVKFLQERDEPLARSLLPPGKTFHLNTEDGTFEDTKMNAMPRTYEADKFYNFHVNEHENFRSFGQGSRLLENFGEYEGKSGHEDAFAGYKDIRCASGTSTIRSSKGTVRGVKNRVRNGIATFLQMQQPNIKNYKEKDLGKVVLYTTSMGIIRDTYAKCANVKQILRTLLVKFEERDVFMSLEYQAEIKERMHSEIIKVPQLFVEGQHIGDAETVERLNESGELRQLLKPYKSIATTFTCQTCGGYRLLPCPSCNGSKKSVHRNHFTAEFVALKCMNCDEVGLVKCHNC